MMAMVWREQVLLDDIDAKILGNDACILELMLSKRSGMHVKSSLLLLSLSRGSGG